MERSGSILYRGLAVADQSHMRGKLSERSPTMDEYTTDPIWVGLDVHQNSVTAAVLYGDSSDPEIIRMGGGLNPVRKLFRRLSKAGTPRSCYEASGAGYVFKRALDNDGFHCDVIAPSLIPRKPGDRRKTDRLDAVLLARLYRSGISHRLPFLTKNRRLLASLYGHDWLSSSTSPDSGIGSSGSWLPTGSASLERKATGPRSTGCGP